MRKVHVQVYAKSKDQNLVRSTRWRRFLAVRKYINKTSVESFSVLCTCRWEFQQEMLFQRPKIQKNFPGGMPPEPPRRWHYFCFMVLAPHSPSKCPGPCIYKSKYKKVGVLPIRIVWSIVSSIGPSSKKKKKVFAVHRPFYISICISTLPTQHTTFIPCIYIYMYTIYIYSGHS